MDGPASVEYAIDGMIGRETRLSKIGVRVG